VKEAEGTVIYETKMKADVALNRARIVLREELRSRARKMHFRNADTLEFNRQFGERFFP
jgi:hypothetical protein